jgi:pimeloyl-ACP methyl ester carboxylesterase
MQATTTAQSAINLHFEEHGSGEPVLFIHGFGANTYSWRHLIPLLSARHRLLLVDLKGFGKSPKPQDNDYAIYHQVRLLAAFIRQHDLRNPTIVGHSYGGGIALLLALHLADDERVRPKRLVLIDSMAYRQSLPLFLKILRTPVAGAASVSMLPSRLQARAVLKLAYYDDAKIPAEAITAYAEPLDMPGGRHAALRTAQQMIPPDFESIQKRYKEISIPTLILWGREDAVVPLRVGEQLHADIPNSKLVVLDRCGHIPHEEMPEAAGFVVADFLRNP